MTNTVSFKLDRALLIKLDGLAANRSDFIREAIEEKLARSNGAGKSVWDALAGTANIDVSIPKASGKVKRVKL